VVTKKAQGNGSNRYYLQIQKKLISAAYLQELLNETIPQEKERTLHYLLLQAQIGLRA
jgi:hypothetical protein